MVKTQDQMRDEKLEAEARKKRMEDTAARIGMTDSGARFLSRMYEIGRAKPLREDKESDEDE